MPETIIDCLLDQAQAAPDALAFRFVGEAGKPARVVSYGELVERAGALAHVLSRSAPPGERALLLCSPGLDGVIALYACFLAGLLAVPTSAPHHTRISAHSDRLLTLVRDCRPKIVLATPDQFANRTRYAQFAWELAEPIWIDAGEVLPRAPALNLCRAGDLAVLQYTSGSTSVPRGVRLTHANLLTNQRAVGRITRPTHQAELMSWLPFYHDMGLCFYLQGVFLGIGCTLMSPQQFAYKPLQWLEVMDEFRCTGSAAPPFALDRVADQLAHHVPQHIDLSCIGALVIGAEPIRPRTIERFLAAVAPLGWRPETLFPSYGLAECTLMATCTTRGGATTCGFDVAQLRNGTAAAVPADDGDPNVVHLISNGDAAPGHEVIIADAGTGRRLEANRIGEVWVRGPSVGAGYWGHAENDCFKGRTDPLDGREYLRTGDLGFQAEGELYITGRLKDLIIINGRNIHPGDVEDLVRRVDDHIGEGVAAFEFTAGEPSIGVLAELRIRRMENADELAARLRQRIGAQFELPVGFVGLIPPLHLPRTTSGKIQRGIAARSVEHPSLRLIGQWRALAHPVQGEIDDARAASERT